MKNVTTGFIVFIIAVLAMPSTFYSMDSDGRVLVGVNYFSGWWETLPNKWHGKGWNAGEQDWRPVFPARVPVLGEYNNQATMDREIAAAAGHGVDFFSILWYFPGAESSNALMLNRGLENYIASTNSGMMRFMIEYCNAPSFSAATGDEWRDCVKTWLTAMKHSSYLRVDGRLVFKIHGADQFLKTHSRDPGLCRRRLGELRDAVRSAGLGEMIIGGGIMSRNRIKAEFQVAELFDFTATYMSIPDVEIRENEYTYVTLAGEARAARVQHANDPIPWMPYLAAGWNPRPWTHPKAAANHRLFFAFPTDAEWLEELKLIKSDFVKYPKLGLPKLDGGCQPVFTIYAWNEFGEGGIVAPTRGEGYMKLEAIRACDFVLKSTTGRVQDGRTNGGQTVEVQQQ